MQHDEPLNKQSTKQHNHTVPRMLLNRFAFRIAGKEHYVWQFRREAKPFQSNTRKSSAIIEFYGDPSNGLEASFSVMEGQHSDLLNAILASNDPRGVEDELRSLVWSLTIRTANLRSNIGQLLSSGLGEMVAQADRDTVNQWLPGQLDKEFDAVIDDLAERLPSVQSRAFRISLERRPALRIKLRQYADLYLDHIDAPGAIQSLLAALQSQLDCEKAMTDAHVRSLERLPTIGHVPDTFRPADWRIIRTEPQSVIIGDGACFATQVSGEPAHLLRYAKEWTEIYLPISHDAVLLACRSAQPKLLDIDEINRASASLSYDQFFAARNTECEMSLQSLIRTGVATMTHEEIKQIVREAWSGQ